jgi:hypothetical protein
LACTASGLTASPISVRSENGHGVELELADSIFEKSRMSLRIPAATSADELDRSRPVALLGRQLGVEHQLRHADDAVHRRADLVAHVREELALGAAGRPRRSAGR